MKLQFMLPLIVVLLSSHGCGCSEDDLLREEVCTKGGESGSCTEENSSEGDKLLPAFLHDDESEDSEKKGDSSNDDHDVFGFLDRNQDGLLDHEELDVFKNSEDADGINRIFFLMGKLNGEFLTLEELKILRSDGIRILNKKEFSLWIERLLEKNLISPVNVQNFNELFENKDSDNDDNLSTAEQIEAAKEIHRRLIKITTIARGFGKLDSKMFLPGLMYKNVASAHAWINSFIRNIFIAHYEDFHENIIANDQDKNGYLNRKEITNFLQDCELTKNALYGLITGDDKKPCSSDALSGPKTAALIGYQSKTIYSWSTMSNMKLYVGLWKSMDFNSRGYILLEDFKDYLKIVNSISMLGEGEVRVITRDDVLNYVDPNADNVVTIYEMHSLIEHFRQVGHNDATIYKVFRSNWEGPLTEDYDKGRKSKTKIPFSIYQIFELFDEDLNGKINFKELRLTIEIVRLYIRTLWVNSMYNFVDEDKNEQICFAEFQKLLKIHLYSFGKDICPDSIKISKDHSMKLFNLIDTNDDHSITKVELYQLIESVSDVDKTELKKELLQSSEFLYGNNIHSTTTREQILCKSYWVDFIDVISNYGNETLKTEIVEKYFHKFDTNEDKWINFAEYKLFFEQEQEKWKVVDAFRFIEWLTEWLKGEPDFYSSQTLEEFQKYDHNEDHIISKGELIAFLQNHRTDYYTNERTNGRFSRFDRNRDGHISFAEYYFLSLLKTRRQY